MRQEKRIELFMSNIASGDTSSSPALLGPGRYWAWSVALLPWRIRRKGSRQQAVGRAAGEAI